MSDGPLVSVLIPCFNAGRWIDQALGAVRRQAYRNLEVIVVDDGSADGSATVVEWHAAADPRVRSIRQARMGACAARNRAWSEARGAFLHFLDADDLLSPDKIGQQLEALAAAPQGCVASCAWRPFRGEPGDLPAVQMAVFRNLSPMEWFVRHLSGGGHIAVGGWLVPRTVAELAGPWNEQLTSDQDGDWFGRVVAASRGIVFVDGPLLHYRRVPGSLSALKTSHDVWSRMHATDTKAKLAARQFGIDLASETTVADDYNNLLVAGWPLSRPYQRELSERIALYGGARRKVELGGRAARMLSQAIGWKLTRRLQRASWRLQAASPFRAT